MFPAKMDFKLFLVFKHVITEVTCSMFFLTAFDYCLKSVKHLSGAEWTLVSYSRVVTHDMILSIHPVSEEPTTLLILFLMVPVFVQRTNPCVQLVSEWLRVQHLDEPHGLLHLQVPHTCGHIRLFLCVGQTL